MDKHSFTTKHLLQRSLLSYMLYPASRLYAGYMLLRRRYLFPMPYKAAFRVISIGNLTSGGSGKTPITIALAAALKEKGLNVVVASRGYHAAWEDQGGMISDGRKLLTDVSKAGDEALMVASALPGIPVLVGRKRKQVLLQAEKLKPDLLILDDAMQHLKVARDLDIVVFDSKVGLGNGWVIPAGYLREPLSALPENSIILLHSKNGHVAPASLQNTLLRTGLPLFVVHSSADTIISDGRMISPQALAHSSLSLISAIAHPSSFEASAQALALPFRKHYAFPDHFAFAPNNPDMNRFLQEARNQADELYICTDKDYQKLQQITLLKDRLLCLSLKTTLDPALVDKVMGVIDN
ncbi:MAG TPA: tetraacyldisaccharide 4'-kinase [Candidatus Cloacimonas sp.]|nr:tetraacyldisaccharide 4'-kinase [Candidatus Cloacimonas sp.]